MKEIPDKPPIDGMTQIPEYIDNPVMFGAWAKLLSWACSQDELIKQFKDETGYNIQDVVRSTGINKMVDEATGYTKTVVVAWADWVTKNLWGVVGQKEEDN
jgi:hypothetical protein